MTDEVIYDYHRRGPYGTNLGDIWAIDGSDMADRLNAEGLIGIWEVLKDEDTGKIEARVYSVRLDNPDPDMQALIANAREGTMKYLEAQAANN